MGQQHGKGNMGAPNCTAGAVVTRSGGRVWVRTGGLVPAWHGAPALFDAAHLPGSPVSSHCPCIPRIFATVYLACWELWELCLWGQDAAKRVAEQRLESQDTDE